MSVVHILHLTDLHLHADPTWDQKVLLDALKTDLSKLRFSQSAPSVAFFTGDLAQAADASGSYEAVVDYSLELLGAAGLDESRMVVCPGNHDLSRQAVGASLPALRNWRGQAATLTGANELLGHPDFTDYAASAFECYDSFAHEFAQPSRTWSGPLSSSYYFRDLGIGIVVLNTASLGGGGLEADFGDRGQLCVPERAVIEAMRGLPAGVPRFVIGHHPTSWMNDSNSSLLETLLSKDALGYFHGHLHESRPRQIASLAGEYLSVQSGALYSSREYWNGYAVVSIDLDRNFSRVAYRRWFEQRREFARAEDIGDAGTFYNSDSSRQYWEAVTPIADPISMERWRSTELLPELKIEYSRFIGDESPDAFVKPSFDREVAFAAETDGRVGSRLEILQYNDLIKSTDNIIVSARPETGKTTLLKRLAIDLCNERPATGAKTTIPVVIDFSAIRGYSSYIETLIRQKLPELPDRHTVKTLLSSGTLALLIDEVDFSLIDKRKALVSFITANPKCRYIFTSSTLFVESSALRPEIVPGIPFTRIRLRQFEDRQLLTLIENHGTTDPLKADQMLSRVLRDASALNVPLTAVTGTFIIQILIDDPDHTLLNQAALIERYIEMLLQKYAPRELLPGTFDFRNKVDLLSFVAEQMVRLGDFSPLENTVVDWCLDYLRGFGLSFSARDLISYFIEARVFERSGERIGFRLRMFFEFFVAIRMTEEPDFREYIFDDSRYLLFANEIGFYSALSRKDKVKLEEIFAKFSNLSLTIFSKERGIEDADSFFETFIVPDKKTTESEIYQIQQRIASPEQILRDREDVLNEELADRDLVQDVIKERPVTEEEIWTSQLLLLSRMIKHMELIPDADKRRLLAGILQGWVRFAASSMSIAGSLAKDRRVVFNNITYVSTLPENLPIGEVARRLVLSMPTAVARMATNLLGTEKLRSQLEEGLGSDTESPTRQFMRFAILADIGTADISKSATKVAAAMRGHIYLEHAFARKLYEIAVRFRLPKSEILSLQTLVSKMFVGLERVDGSKAASRKSHVIGSMSRQRLLLNQSEVARKRARENH